MGLSAHQTQPRPLNYGQGLLRTALGEPCHGCAPPPPSCTAAAISRWVAHVMGRDKKEEPDAPPNLAPEATAA